MESSRKSFVLTIVSAVLGLLLAGPLTSLAAGVDGRLDMLVKNAQTYSKKGDHFMAAMYYDQAIRLRPFDMNLYYQRAFARGRSGNYLNAINDFNRVIYNASSSYPAAVRFRADCYLAMGQYQRAANDYDSFLQGDPGDGKVWSYLAETYALMGRHDLALSAIKKGLATKSHWSGNLEGMRMQIMSGQTIKPHRPLSN